MPVREARRHKALEDRAEVARLTREGQSERAIARVLGVSPRMIHKHRVLLRREWEYSANRNFAEHVAERLANYEAALAAAWVKLRETGSVKWLQAILDCNRHICELLGLDDAHRQVQEGQHTAEQGEPIPSGMSREEFELLRQSMMLGYLRSCGVAIPHDVQPVPPPPAVRVLPGVGDAGFNGNGHI